jgi:protein-L-isoaspartate(D-aspartate) O-methyltransferase
MNFEQARFNMVEQQIRTWDVLDQDVLDLLFAVRREDFVPPTYRNLAFSDTEIPLGFGACMLAPAVEARALQALQLKRNETAFEVGAGSGYMAALLAACADRVWSAEIVPQLAEMAKANLRRAGTMNASVEVCDGLPGLPAQAPFDVIMISGAVPVVPRQLLDQLKPGGRLFAIVGVAPVMEAQLITRMGEDGFRTVNLFETQTATLANAPRAEAFVF